MLSFRQACIQPSPQFQSSTLISFITSQRPVPSCILEKDPLSFDIVSIPPIVRPQLPLKRSSSTMSSNESDSKQKIRVLVKAIDSIVNILTTLKKELQTDELQNQ